MQFKAGNGAFLVYVILLINNNVLKYFVFSVTITSADWQYHHQCNLGCCMFQLPPEGIRDLYIDKETLARPTSQPQYNNIQGKKHLCYIKTKT